MKKAAPLLLLPAAMLALGFFARGLAGSAMDAFNTYQSPFAFTNPKAISNPALSKRVVVYLIDGLGHDNSRDLPFLNKLRAQGADSRCAIGLPSLSLPGRAVMLTGAWQEVHGQMTNKNPRPVRVEHVFETARRQGLATTLAAGEGTQTMFAPYVSHSVVYEDMAESDSFENYEAMQARMDEQNRALLAEPEQAPFTFLEYHLVDECGHGWGAASPEYAKAARAADAEIEKLAALLDLKQTTLIVTADHGHVPEGGHGGPEPQVMSVPLVMAGAGIRPGTTGDSEQIDIAPTLSALLGVAIPASNQGRPLLDFLDVTEAQRLAFLNSLMEQRESFVSHYVAWVSERSVPAPAMPAASTQKQVEERLASLKRAADDARDARIELEAGVRSRQAIVVAVLPIAIFVLLLALRLISGHELLYGFFAAAFAFGVYHLMLPVLGLHYSFTAVNKDEWMGRFFLKDMSLAVVLCALAVFAVAALQRTSRALVDVARLAFVVSAAFCTVFLIKIALVYWRQGAFLVWHLPDQYWGFGFYLDVLAVMAVCFASLAMPVIAWLGARLRSPA